MGVAGAAEAGRGAVGPAGGAPVEDATGAGQAAGSTIVINVHIGAKEIGRDGAGGGNVATRVGGPAGRVGIWHRPARLLHTVGNDTVVGHRQHAALDLRVVVGVLKGQELPCLGVDQGLESPLIAVECRPDDPGQAVVKALADGNLFGVPAHGDGNQHQLALAPLAIDGIRTDVRLHGLGGGFLRDPRRRR